jgi:hypothetical protein
MGGKILVPKKVEERLNPGPTDRYLIAAILQSEPMLNVIQREIREINQSAEVDSTQLAGILRNEIFKRDLIESDEAKTAIVKVNKIIAQKEKAITFKKEHADPSEGIGP